jgi:hypothetical protein
LTCEGLLARIQEIEKNDAKGSTGQHALKRNATPIFFEGNGVGEFREGADGL